MPKKWSCLIIILLLTHEPSVTLKSKSEINTNYLLLALVCRHIERQLWHWEAARTQEVDETRSGTWDVEIKLRRWNGEAPETLRWIKTMTWSGTWDVEIKLRRWNGEVPETLRWIKTMTWSGTWDVEIKLRLWNGDVPETLRWIKTMKWWGTRDVEMN